MDRIIGNVRIYMYDCIYLGCHVLSRILPEIISWNGVRFRLFPFCPRSVGGRDYIRNALPYFDLSVFRLRYFSLGRSLKHPFGPLFSFLV